jgi:hypothetical protein
MKSKIIICMLLMFVALVYSCKRKDEQRKDFDYSILVIDNCQYLQFNTAMGYKGIVHKGDCRNTIHCRNSEKQ